MTREWVDDLKPAPKPGEPDNRDKRWVMRCDVYGDNGVRCTSQGAPSMFQPPLAPLARDGWFIGELFGDICPQCLARGVKPWTKPHAVNGATA